MWIHTHCIWCGFDRVVWHKCHSMVTLLGHKVWNLVISNFFQEYLSQLCCMSTSPDLWATKPISRECKVTKFTSNNFQLSKYWRILFESCLFLCCWPAIPPLHWSLFQLLNCWNSSLISAHTGLNRSQVNCCPVLIHHKPGCTHKRVLYDYAPPSPSYGHFLHSLDLHDPIPNPFRLDESSQKVNPVHILHSQEGSSASPGGLLCQSLLSRSAGR